MNTRMNTAHLNTRRLLNCWLAFRSHDPTANRPTPRLVQVARAASYSLVPCAVELLQSVPGLPLRAAANRHFDTSPQTALDFALARTLSRNAFAECSMLLRFSACAVARSTMTLLNLFVVSKSAQILGHAELLPCLSPASRERCILWRLHGGRKRREFPAHSRSALPPRWDSHLPSCVCEGPGR